MVMEEEVRWLREQMQQLLARVATLEEAALSTDLSHTLPGAEEPSASSLDIAFLFGSPLVRQTENGSFVAVNGQQTCCALVWLCVLHVYCSCDIGVLWLCVWLCV
jgi:hypothetical protein